MDPHRHIAKPSLNKNEAIIAAVLSRSDKALSAYQILAQTQAMGVRAPQQVYRALERLMELHLVHRIESLNAYVQCCASPHRHEAAFAICQKCQSVTEIELHELLPALEARAATISFKLTATHVELAGICGQCRNGPAISP